MRKALLASLAVVLIAGCDTYYQGTPGKWSESSSQESNEDSERIAELTDHFLRKAFGLEPKRDEPEHTGPKRAEPSTVTGYCDKISPIITKAITPSNRNVRILAVGLAKHSPGEYNIWQVCMIWYGLKNTWSYVNDPRGSEYVASASDSAVLMAGDCDDFAVLMTSMIEAIGGSSRIVAAQNEQGGHMYSEVYLSSSKIGAEKLIGDIAKLDQKRSNVKKGFSYRTDSSGCWLNLDWSAEHPGGPYFSATFEVLIYPDGRCVRNK